MDLGRAPTQVRADENMQNRTFSTIRSTERQPSRGGIARRLVLALCTLGLLSLAACGSHEFDDVRQYKVFLEGAKPALTGMNKAREDLYQVNDPEQMLPLFRDSLLPRVEELSKAANDEKVPSGKLGDIHQALQSTLTKYAESTKKLVEHLKSAKEDEREQAIVAWGEEDQKFGKSMSGLVNDLSAYLSELKK
jgi:hypothetical protein